jgi:hypothetical protein
MKKLLLLALGPALLLAVANAQSTAPTLKEGYWSFQIKTSANDPDSAVTKICRSHAYDNYANALAKPTTAACKTLSDSASGGKRTVDMECKMESTAIRTKSVTTMTGDTAFHSESHVTYTPPIHGESESMVIIDEKYLGACPAGIVPGDRVYGDGRISHLWKH